MGDWGQQPPPGGFGPPGGGYPPAQGGGFPPQGGGGGYPPQGGAFPPPADMQKSPATDPLAIASLALSVVAALLCCIPCIGYISPVLFIAGIVCGALAITRINKDPMLTGKGLAIAGIAVGGVFLILWVLMLVLGVGSSLLAPLMQGLQQRH